MTDQIKTIYSKLVSPVKKSTGIDLSEIGHAHAVNIIMQELQNDNRTENEKKDLWDYYRKSVYEYEKKKEVRERKRIEQERLPKTEEEAFFINAKLLHDININYELNTIFLVSDTIKNFYQLSPEGLEIYIYWRTNLRKGVLLDVSSGFMSLYLKEVCAMIEYESPQDAFNHLLDLYSMTENIEYARKYKNIIIRAIKFVAILYYDKISNSTLYIKKYFKDVNAEYDDKKYFLDGKYGKCIDYINHISSYKFMESCFYKDNAEFYNRCLVRVIKEFLRICEENGFDFTRACIGSFKELPYKEDYFFRNNVLWYEGTINLENGYYVRVNQGKFVETVISRAWVVNDTLEKAGGMLYYLVWYLEKIVRTYMGEKRNLRPTLNKLDKLREKTNYRDDFTKLKEIYLSEEFISMVDRIVKEEHLNLLN